MYENDKTIYVVMEFLEGKKLFELIKEKTDREGNFTEEEAKKIIKKLLEAITYWHSKEIMHKDLKPKKIFIEKEGEIKITDFAMSKWDFLNKEQLMQATSYYLAPEVLKKVRTAKSDLWSVGAITYTMLSGFLPFVSDANQTVFQKANKGEYSKRTMNIKSIYRVGNKKREFFI